MSTLLMTGAPAVAPTALTQDGHLGLGEAIVFGVVALVTVACGIGVLTAKRAVNAAINMIGIMISLAVLYIVNESPFMGITQVVVYTGAVMTLVLFVIMLVGVGGDEPVGAAGTVMRRPVLILLGLGLAGELTAILLIVAAVGALTLTHRQRIRARLSQRAVAAGKMQDYAAKGAHPGQKPMPGVYASTNSAAAPALDAQGEAVEESVPRVLRARGQGLELSDVSPEMGLAQRSGTIVSRLAGADQAGAGDSTRGPRDARRSGMPSMPGAAAPAVKQPVLSDDGAADSAAPEQKEEK